MRKALVALLATLALASCGNNSTTTNTTNHVSLKTPEDYCKAKLNDVLNQDVRAFATYAIKEYFVQNFQIPIDAQFGRLPDDKKVINDHIKYKLIKAVKNQDGTITCNVAVAVDYKDIIDKLPSFNGLKVLFSEDDWKKVKNKVLNDFDYVDYGIETYTVKDLGSGILKVTKKKFDRDVDRKQIQQVLGIKSKKKH